MPEHFESDPSFAHQSPEAPSNPEASNMTDLVTTHLEAKADELDQELTARGIKSLTQSPEQLHRIFSLVLEGREAA